MKRIICTKCHWFLVDKQRCCKRGQALQTLPTRANSDTISRMALTAVDLSLTSKRITPTLSHGCHLRQSLTQAAGSRGGVASVQVCQKPHRRQRHSQRLGTDQPIGGKLLVGHERKPGCRSEDPSGVVCWVTGR